MNTNVSRRQSNHQSKILRPAQLRRPMQRQRNEENPSENWRIFDNAEKIFGTTDAQQKEPLGDVKHKIIYRNCKFQSLFRRDMKPGAYSFFEGNFTKKYMEPLSNIYVLYSRRQNQHFQLLNFPHNISDLPDWLAPLCAD